MSLAFGSTFGSPFSPFFGGSVFGGFGFPAFGALAPTFSTVPGPFGFPFGAPAQFPAVGEQVHHTGAEPNLYYFGTYGLAQAIRLIFVEAGVHFHETEIDTAEEWAAIKPRLPFGQLPALDIDGTTIVQSNAIVRFLGRKYNLYGRDIYEQAEVDAVIDAMNDVKAAFPLRAVLMATVEGGDVDAALGDLADFQKSLARLEHYLHDKIVRSRLPDNAPLYFVGAHLTIADLVAYAYLHMFAEASMSRAAFEPFTLVQRALDSTFSRPNIQAFLTSERAFPPLPPADKMKHVFGLLYSPPQPQPEATQA